MYVYVRNQLGRNVESHRRKGSMREKRIWGRGAREKTKYKPLRFSPNTGDVVHTLDFVSHTRSKCISLLCRCVIYSHHNIMEIELDILL